MGISVVSVAEIQKGISRMPVGRRQKNLQDWLDNELVPRFGARVIPLELSDLQRLGRLLGEGKKTGEPLPPVGTVACIMLEPGTRVSHRAAALAARVPPTRGDEPSRFFGIREAEW